MRKFAFYALLFVLSALLVAVLVLRIHTAIKALLAFLLAALITLVRIRNLRA